MVKTINNSLIGYLLLKKNWDKIVLDEEKRKGTSAQKLRELNSYLTFNITVEKRHLGLESPTTCRNNKT